MEYTVRLFYNTGFNKENIPDSLSTLELTATHNEIVSNSFYFFQNSVMSTLKLEKTFIEVAGIDYVTVTPISTPLDLDVMIFYTVENITMLNDNVAELELLIDPLNSIGNSSQYYNEVDNQPAVNDIFRNLKFVSGVVERANTPRSMEEAMTTSSLQIINTSEPWAPDNALRCVNQVKIKIPDYQPNITVIPSYLDLTEVNATAKTYEDSITGESVTIPSLPLLNNETEFRIYESDGINLIHKTSLNGLGLYNAKYKPIAKGIRNARALGLDNLIMDPYIIPMPSSFLNPGGMYEYISSNEELIDIGKYNYSSLISGVDNVKVFELYRTVNLLSITTGDSVTFSAEEIYRTGNRNYFDFIWFKDYLPGGKTYIRPKASYGYLTDTFQKCITSTTWTSPGMVVDTPSGSLNQMIANTISTMSNEVNNKIGIAQYEFSNMREDINIATNSVNTAGNIISSAFRLDIGGIISAGAAGLQDSINSINNKASNIIGMASLQRNTELAEMSLKLERAKVTIGGDVFSTPSFNTMNYTGPLFIYSEINLSDFDVLKFNSFLNLFGYTYNMPVSNNVIRGDFLKGRQKCNFLKTNNVKLDMYYPKTSPTGTYKPSFLLKLAETRLNSGVRIWHTSIKNYTGRNPVV